MENLTHHDLIHGYVGIATVFYIILGLIWDSSGPINWLVKVGILIMAYCGLQLVVMHYFQHVGDYATLRKLSNTGINLLDFTMYCGGASVFFGAIWPTSNRANRYVKIILAGLAISSYVVYTILK